ncbi:MAG: transglutaminase-like domain-containing protein [Candidatus Dormibacteria bacterium]
MQGSARRRLRIGCEFVHRLEWPVVAVLQVEPYPGESSVVHEELTTHPRVPLHQHRDLYGNRCRRFVIGPGDTRIRYLAEVEVSAGVDDVDVSAAQVPTAELPPETLHFTLPSRFCESDILSNTAWKLFGDVPSGWSRVQAVVDWVHDNISFCHGASTPTTTASQVYLQRQGVCRDFAQLAVAFLRALNIPARYCFGYLPDIDVPPPGDPMDFAGWLEAYVGGRWYTVDPRNNQRRTGRVLIGRGRDAVDVAMLTTYGLAPLVGMRVVAEPVEAEPWSSASPPLLGSFSGATA